MSNIGDGVTLASDDTTVDSNSDADSSYGDGDGASETTSLKSSIYNYQYRNGRRYNGFRAGEYLWPNDEQQLDQLDIMHHIFNLTLDGELFLAPIGKHPQRVLDLGTGTGIWAIEFADRFPSASVIGTDLSPIQPSMVPPNLQFEIDDCCEEWLYTKESFDFIHIRLMNGAVADWPALYAEAFAHLKPGGWIESVEGNGIRSDDAWGKLIIRSGDEVKQDLRGAGFVDITERRFKWPIGGWCKNERLKEIGTWNRLNFEQGMEGWCWSLCTNVLGWKPEKVQMMLAEMRLMLRQKGVHAYNEVVFVYGRKPSAKISADG
ncbi:SAM dependent methyltransferase [Mytilinidion resinicola]|uniref:SAM dependent methyltransferase n=1 Tax=Mytilinidion resinicola TaxID=574789 RepID=A0A6A6YNM0_9PEZI|nr:SAM dependent methyltransferase [Mytilinidion resinicola]KAF2810341.1 SAM dependent methyltransferase [Mytilinidion resinicola]